MIVAPPLEMALLGTNFFTFLVFIVVVSLRIFFKIYHQMRFFLKIYHQMTPFSIFEENLRLGTFMKLTLYVCGIPGAEQIKEI